MVASYNQLLLAILLYLLHGHCCSAHSVVSLAHQASQTTTTTIAPSLEDPSNAATSESSAGNDDEADLCFKCYDKLMVAQNLVAIHESLADKEKRLIRQKAAAAAAAASQSASGASSSNNNNNNIHARKPKPAYGSDSRSTNFRNPPQNQHYHHLQHQNNSTISVRNGRIFNEQNSNNNNNNGDSDKPQIIVSRLRVARSPPASDPSAGFDFIQNLDSIRNGSKNNIDPVLKRLKHKQEQHFNKTCKSLYEVQGCLEELSRDCLGNLQFHSIEVVSKQWSARLNCPPKNYPEIKPFPALTRSIPSLDEPIKAPISRPISTPEETRRKLDIMFGRNPSPLGVMLKPTLTRSASQKFNSPAIALAAGGSQQLMANGNSLESADSLVSRGRHLMSPNDIAEYDLHKISLISQLALLVPCFALAAIALITITVRYFRPRSKV